MTYNALQRNISRIKEIVREMYVFSNQMKVIENLEKGGKVSINPREKKLLNNAVYSLTAQLKILNNSIPDLVEGVGFYKKIPAGKAGVAKPSAPGAPPKKLIQIKYSPGREQEKILITVGEKDRKKFLENLSKSNLSIYQLKKKYSAEKPGKDFGKPHLYAKLSNRFFKRYSQNLLAKGHLDSLNKDLRKINSPFVVSTYASMIFLTMAIAGIISLFLMIFLLFVKVSFTFPFVGSVTESILLRFAKVFWIIFAIPLATGILMYFYPKTEGKNIGSKINQELPFVAIHMSAIATSGVQPVNIFKIIVRSEEYKYSRTEFKKLLNLINFQGYDLATALKTVSRASPSIKMRELLDGMSTTITSGGDLHSFLSQHARSLLFDYRLEREKYTKTSETFMDIYISIVIAAPMILLMLFVIMGSTGIGGFNPVMMGFIIILIIIFLNIGFLIFLKLKQPVF